MVDQKTEHPSATQDEFILKMEHITKTFPGVKALDDIELKVRRGTVHAVMGENGAGKSTMMKCLLGIYKADAGTVHFDGEYRHYSGPKDALESGLAMIHQELSTVGQLTVAENIFLGREKTSKGFLQKKEMQEDTQKLFDQLNIAINPRTKMGALSVSQQQMCEIAKAISYDAQLIIMDEPTSSITESEVAHLFQMIRTLLDRGITIIYISHKMDEIFEISDEISIYRDGQYIATRPTKETSSSQLIELMVGRTLTDLYPKEPASIGSTCLRVEGLSREGEFENVSFELKRGEILGMAGLIGAGRTEVAETIFGIRKPSAGKVYVDGQETHIHSPQDAIAYRIGLLTEDRKGSGCFLPLNITLNTCMASLDKASRGPFVDYGRARESATKMREALSIKTPSLNQKIENLSGGNQQKVLVGRWLLTEPDILIVDEPTRGIDVGAKREIYKLLSDLAVQGKAIIMISSEMPELLGMCDRILVMAEGHLTGTLDASEATQERILQFATYSG